MERLKHAVQRLALDPPAQVAQFPDFVVVADELALDLDHWLEVCEAWSYIDSPDVVAALKTINDHLDQVSGSEQAERWTVEALAADPGWIEVRAMAREALVAAGWAAEAPPTPEEDGDVFVSAGS